ncbi:hypothetical protein P43SY_005775 [Pythium insidiosum]|uniref:EF-hand domain-containing protein n=1 Tax=Pythium insidiosum TaxID=114742 RepID=A0AAD5M9U0_PYTIN|nr:hypothetical protein P43SY_005775 [Pythium insidiosum]
MRRRELASESGSSAEGTSYLPRIIESHTAREFREQRARHGMLAIIAGVSSSYLSTATTRPTASRSRRPTARKASVDGKICSADAWSAHGETMEEPLQLDRAAMEVLYKAFEELGELDEEGFVGEVLRGMERPETADAHVVETASQLRALFRQADLRGDGVLTWESFSSFASQTSDVTTALEDTVINRYQADAAPSPINHAAEVTNMVCSRAAFPYIALAFLTKLQFFLPEVERMLIHDTRAKGFHVFQLLDAVYSPLGRYVITASTSPVISFYDVDHLKIRQQLPAETWQTALTLHSSSTPILYSASATGHVHAWDLQALRHRHAFFTRHDDPHRVMTDIEMLESMGALASASMDGNIYLLDLLTDKVRRTMRGHRKGVSILRYCADNRYLLSAGLDHSVQVWNPHLEKNVGSLPGHRHQLIGLDVRPGTPEIITADESGIIKIWDLRKFAAVQTIVRELYVKEHSTSTSRSARGRPLRTMCYLSSHQRIAVAHSTIFFLDAKQGRTIDDARGPTTSTTRRTIRTASIDQDIEEKPLGVFYSSPSRAFVVVTATQMQHWALATRRRACPEGHAVSLALPGRVTCAAAVEDLFSCVLGCDDGTLARVMMPSGTVVSSAKLHAAEVSALRCLSTLKLVVSSATDGTIFVSEWDTLQLLHRLDHWRAVQSSRGVDIPPPRAALSPAFDIVYAVPLRLRAFFIGNEVERLKLAFASEDPCCLGCIPLSRLPSALHRAFPLSSRDVRQLGGVDDDARTESSPGEQSVTFSMFLELLKDSLTANNEGGRQQWALAEISSLDTNARSDLLISASSSDGTFCVWNLRNRAVVAQGAVSEPGKAKARSIAHVQFLAPSPCFAIVEESSAMFSIWSSVAVPPWLPFTHECLLHVQHPHESDSCSERDDGDLRFITEPEPTQPTGRVENNSVVRSIDWFYGSAADATLCVGDDDGFLALYALSSLLEFVTVHATPKSTNQEDLPRTSDSDPRWASLIRLQRRWRASESGGSVRLVRLVAIPELQQPRTDDHVVVLSVVEAATCVDLWAQSGLRLGRLSMQQGVTADDRLWHLRWDGEATRERERVETTRFLQSMGTHAGLQAPSSDQDASTTDQQDGDEGESDEDDDAIDDKLTRRFDASRKTIAVPPRRVTLFPDRARASPRVSSRSLSVSARFHSSTSSTMRAEEALVAWRRPTSVQVPGSSDTRNDSQRSLLP